MAGNHKPLIVVATIVTMLTTSNHNNNNFGNKVLNNTSNNKGDNTHSERTCWEVRFKVFGAGFSSRPLRHSMISG